MADETGTKLKRAFSSLQQVRNQRDKEYLHIARYVRPQHTPMWESVQNTSTVPTIELLWDDTAIKACDVWSRAVNSMTHNPATDWFNGQDSDKKVNENGNAKAWYGTVTDDMRSQMERSGLYVALLHRLKDIGSYGFGAVYIFEDAKQGNKGRLNVEYVPAPQCFFTLNPDGSVRTFFRPQRWTWPEIEARGIDVQKCDQAVKTAKESSNLEATFLFIHAAYPKEDAPDGGKPDHDFVGYYMEDATGNVLQTHGFHEHPYNVLVWDPVPNSMYPTGIGYITLPEIRNLNAQRKKFDRILDNESDSPTLAPNQDEGHARAALRAGEMVYGGISGDGKRLYEPYYQGSNGSRTLSAEIESSRELIKDAWNNPLFMMVSNQQMTAMEVASRDEKIIQVMGPFIIPMFKSLTLICERFFHARMRAGTYDPLPEIFDADTVVNFDFIGILARAMKKLMSANIVAFYTEAMQTVGLIAPDEVKDGMDHGLAMRAMGDARAIPAGIVLSKDQREAKRAETDAANQNMQMAAAAPGLAKAALDGSQALNNMGEQGNEPAAKLAP